jgi:hypothetical protein
MPAAASNSFKTAPLKLTARQSGAKPSDGPFAEQIFDKPLITVGRAASSSLLIDSEQMAEEQWVIINEDGPPLLVNRAEGTFLQEEKLPLSAQRPLADGDMVRAGDFVVEVNILAGGESQLAADERELSLAPEREAEAEDIIAEPEAVVSEALAARPTNRFAAILDSLRTDEDRYYFLLESGGQSGSRLLVEDQELIVGWDQTGGNITADPWAVALPRLRVTKNWSGVFVAAPHPEEVEVNGEAIPEPRRLRHGDRVVISPALAPEDDGVVLVFHEPTSLVVLDNLLPEALPPPVSPEFEQPAALPVAAEITETPQTPTKGQSLKRKKGKKTRKLYFGAFTVGDLALMLVGTILGAVVVFLFLVYG